MVEAAPARSGRIIHVGVVITLNDDKALPKFEPDPAYERLMAVALRPPIRRYIIYNFTNE
jgi:hypothetical protein